MFCRDGYDCHSWWQARLREGRHCFSQKVYRQQTGWLLQCLWTHLVQQWLEVHHKRWRESVGRGRPLWVSRGIQGVPDLPQLSEEWKSTHFVHIERIYLPGEASEPSTTGSDHRAVDCAKAAVHANSSAQSCARWKLFINFEFCSW